MKPLHFLGSSLRDLKKFPVEVQEETGFELRNLQRGQAPSDWKPMSIIGPGAMELRIHVGGEYRVVYVAKFAEAVYVLHIFAKKTPKTAKPDLELAKRRYNQLLKQRNS